MGRKEILGSYQDNHNNNDDPDMAKCHETAKKNGHPDHEADECDEGSVGCPDCPYKEETKK